MSSSADRERYELPQGVRVDHLRDSAWLVAKAFSQGVKTVSVALTPGDMTVYHVLIARDFAKLHSSHRPESFARWGEWIVSLLNLGRSQTWAPDHSGWTDWTCVLGHWTDDEYTTRVLAAFLNMLREALREYGPLVAEESDDDD